MWITEKLGLMVRDEWTGKLPVQLLAIVQGWQVPQNTTHRTLYLYYILFSYRFVLLSPSAVNKCELYAFISQQRLMEGCRIEFIDCIHLCGKVCGSMHVYSTTLLRAAIRELPAACMQCVMRVFIYHTTRCHGTSRVEITSILWDVNLWTLVHSRPKPHHGA